MRWRPCSAGSTRGGGPPGRTGGAGAGPGAPAAAGGGVGARALGGGVGGVGCPAGSNGGRRDVTDAVDGEGVLTALEAAGLAGVPRFVLVSGLSRAPRAAERAPTGGSGRPRH